MKHFRCKDVGMSCDWEFRGQTENEVMRAATEHGQKAHGIRQMTSQLSEKVRQSIRTE